MSIASPIPVPINAPDSVPEASSEKRDAFGRRVEVSFESRQIPPGTPVGDHWLVAIDGSRHSMHALAMAIRLASESSGCMLDLINVQPWLSKEAAESELHGLGWRACADACASLDANRLGWRLHVLMGEPAQCIVAKAKALDSRGIVIGTRGLTVTQDLLLGSVAQQVIHTARGALLIVRTPVNHIENPSG